MYTYIIQRVVIADTKQTVLQNVYILYLSLNGNKSMVEA